MIFRKIYLSTAPHAPTADQLLSLMEVARRNNSRDGITGLTAYHDYTFIQVLEGPFDKVEACFHRILQNPMHDNILVAHEEYAKDRIFDDYAMAFVPLKGADAASAQAFEDLRKVFHGPRAAQIQRDATTAGFLEAFRQSLPGL
ncbi:BLUF domain-containing protein [Cognatishimia sp. SS12]|uniref:BLUF domain-containing protein n=1 Tax=Cognatishimia sp. SS12 TaxID=2979465 RepID=UPI00232DBD45|nr:BLUF domain-containing protein [Cognatishimia sp. SS12]MDC0736707.1 BLUF domain-containing protein [Cognatishimia sp. SS12]